MAVMLVPSKVVKLDDDWAVRWVGYLDDVKAEPTVDEKVVVLVG